MTYCFYRKYDNKLIENKLIVWNVVKQILSGAKKNFWGFNFFLNGVYLRISLLLNTSLNLEFLTNIVGRIWIMSQSNYSTIFGMFWIKRKHMCQIK